MRRIAIGALLLLTGCATHKTSERHELRTDTFRAILAEQLTVSLDDVIILPRDSIRPAIAARRATISRTAAAEVAAKSEAALDETAEETPPAPHRRRPSAPLLFLAIAAIIIFLWVHKSRKGDD